MIQLTHLSGSRQGQVDRSPKAVVKLGRAADCDLRFDATIDRTVSSHHAEIRFDGDGYLLVDTNSSNGTLVNGARVTQHRLEPGDVISLGGEIGPQLRFELAEVSAPGRRGKASSPAAPAPAEGPDEDVLNAAQAAVQRARQSRQAAGGAAPTGQTMFLMVDAINQVVVKKESNFRRNLAIVVGAAVVIIVGIVAAWMIDRARYAGQADEKKGLDTKIAELQTQIDIEEDEGKRNDLLLRLEALTGKAARLTADLEATDKGKTALKEAGIDTNGDFVDQELRKILKEFEADTYMVPPHFKASVKRYVDDMSRNKAGLRMIWARRKNYWPMIQQAFADEQVPEIMAYVAWQESAFDPEICSYVGARGMWQFIPGAAKHFDLRVEGDCEHAKPPSGSYHCPCTGLDERTDPYKASKAAARFLGELLSDFGMDSFMLAMASYNCGAGGVRQILHKKKLRRHRERDFWYLYYMKYLPEETREYVPRIIAAAIVGRNPDKFDLTP